MLLMLPVSLLTLYQNQILINSNKILLILKNIAELLEDLIFRIIKLRKYLACEFTCEQDVRTALNKPA